MPQETYDRSNEPQERSQASSATKDASLDLIALWKVLRAGKRKIQLGALAGFILAAVIGLLTHNYYTATASFIAPSSPTSTSSVAAQLGAAGVSGLGGALRNPADQQIGILNSRSIAMDMVARFNLKTWYGTGKESQAEGALKAATIFDSGVKDGIITVSVTDHDPGRARDMANAYLDELRLANGRLALTDAAQRRLFFEQQMAQEKDALENAEADLQKTQEQTGMLAPAPQTSVEIDRIAAIRADIESREVQLAGMLQGSTNQDPDVIRLRSQISSLEGQLAETMTGNGSGPAGTPAVKVPGLQLEYTRKQREVSYHETIFDILSRQYEAARLDESRDAPTLQVLDAAVLPDTKAGPHRTMMALAGMLLGAILSTIALLIKPLFAQISSMLAPYTARS